MTQLSDLLNELNHNEWSTRKIEDEAARLGHKLNFTTASRYLRGNHPAKPSASVLAAFAAVFRTDVNRLRSVAGQGPVSDRFELPAEADMLDPDERRAVVNLVRVMARRKAHHDREAESQQGPEAGGTQHGSESSSPDGGEAGGPGAPIDLAQARRVKDDPAAFGDQPRRGELDQGKLQPPPPTHKSAAYEPRDGSEGITEAQRARERGEESQDDA